MRQTMQVTGRLAGRWAGASQMVLLASLAIAAPVPSPAAAQQPPFEGALSPEPLEPRERLADENLEGGEAVLFGIHRAATYVLAPIMQFAVDLGVAGGGGSGSVDGLKIRPGSLGSGSGIGASVGYVVYPAPVWAGVSVGASVKGYQEHSAFVGVRDPRGGNFARASFAYDDDTQDEFSGLGMASPEDSESDYEQEEVRLLGDAQAAPGAGDAFRFGGRGGYRKNTILEGTNDDFDDISVAFAGPLAELSGEPLPGLPAPGLQHDYLQGGAFLAFDSRNDARNPDRGLLLAGSFDAFRGVNETPFDWDRWSGEVAGYLPLPDETRVLAGRVLAVHQNPRHGDLLVPFYYLSSLGGSSFLRSFSSFRFQDNDVVYSAAEFRRRVYTGTDGVFAFDASLFVESAGVYRDLTEDLSLGDMEQSFGTELRVLIPNDVMARLGVAVGSSEGSKLYVGGGGRF